MSAREGFDRMIDLGTLIELGLAYGGRDMLPTWHTSTSEFRRFCFHQFPQMNSYKGSEQILVIFYEDVVFERLEQILILCVLLEL